MAIRGDVVDLKNVPLEMYHARTRRIAVGGADKSSRGVSKAQGALELAENALARRRHEADH